MNCIPLLEKGVGLYFGFQGVTLSTKRGLESILFPIIREKKLAKGLL